MLQLMDVACFRPLGHIRCRYMMQMRQLSRVDDGATTQSVVMWWHRGRRGCILPKYGVPDWRLFLQCRWQHIFST